MTLKYFINNKGFTLVENLLYSAIVGVLLSALLLFIFLVSDLRVKLLAKEKINNSVYLAVSVFRNIIQTADIFNTPMSMATSSELIFVSANGKNSHLDINAGRIRLREDGEAEYLTSDKVEISELEFSNFSDGTYNTGIAYSFLAKDRQVVSGRQDGEFRYSSFISLRK